MDRLISVVLIVIFFLVPNIVLVVGGFHSFYLVYIVLSILLALSIPVVAMRRGLEALNVYDSLRISLPIVLIYFILGFIWGFGARPRTTFLSFLVSLGLFFVNLLVVEVSRSIAVNMVRGRYRFFVGVVVGLLFGSTIPKIVDYIGKFLSSPLPVINDVLYSYIITLIHVYGGFVSALLFRIVIDGFWRFSPLIPNITRLGIVWSAISMLIYYGAIVYLYHGIPRLVGCSKEVFKAKKIMKYFNIIVNIAVYSLSILLLLSVYLRIVPMVVISGSMTPTLDIGDIVLINTKKPFNISVGDIIAFRFENIIVIHRVIEFAEKGFRTKGDANRDPDPFIVTEDMVIGKVDGVIPRIGLITIILQHGFEVQMYAVVLSALLIVIIVAVVILVILKSRRKFIPRL